MNAISVYVFHSSSYFQKLEEYNYGTPVDLDYRINGGAVVKI
jgi:hypothetical protein